MKIDLRTGSVLLGTNIRVEPLQSRIDVERQVAPLLEGLRECGGGFELLYLKGVTFGSRPATLALSFRDAKLEQVGLNVEMPHVDEQIWPNWAAVDEEIAFVRRTFAREFKLKLRNGSKRFRWGEIWSGFDHKIFVASHGIDYHRP